MLHCLPQCAKKIALLPDAPLQPLIRSFAARLGAALGAAIRQGSAIRERPSSRTRKPGRAAFRL